MKSSGWHRKFFKLLSDASYFLRIFHPVYVHVSSASKKIYPEPENSIITARYSLVVAVAAEKIRHTSLLTPRRGRDVGPPTRFALTIAACVGTGPHPAGFDRFCPVVPHVKGRRPLPPRQGNRHRRLRPIYELCIRRTFGGICVKISGPPVGYLLWP